MPIPIRERQPGSSYYQRILRGAQSLWPIGNPYRDQVDWNAVMTALMTTGSALAGGMTLTLSASGSVTAAAFNPVPLGGGTLKGWFKADALALSDSDPVSTWTDESGLANHATQAGAARPVFKTGIQNGRPGVLFTAASSQFLAANGLAAVQNGTDLPFSAFVVVRALSLGAFQRYASWGRTTSANPYMLIGQTAANVYEVVRQDDTPAAITRTSAAAANTNPQVMSYAFSGTVINAWRNGANIINAQAMNLGNLTIDRFSLGCFGRVSEANFFNGYLFEVLIYAAALADADRIAIERSLGSKWGITVA